MANFMLSYDLSTAYTVHDQLIAYIKASRNIDQWSEPFLGALLLKSGKSVNSLAFDFQEFFAGKTLHILIELPKNAAGILPQYLWEWINRSDTPALGNFLAQLQGLNALKPD